MSCRSIRSVDVRPEPRDSRSDMVATNESPSESGETGEMAGDATADEAARRVGRLFPEVYRHYHYAQRIQSADLPVTRRAVEVLQHLAAGGPLTVGEQAEHLGLRRNSVSELLTRLEAKGLVARVRDERDERRVLVWLTDAGRDVVSRVGQVLAPDLLSTAMTVLTPAERVIVVRGFELLAGASTPAIPGPATPKKVAASPRRPSHAPINKKGTSR
jgi:DNA-binding MarR family transcriptional regulator